MLHPSGEEEEFARLHFVFATVPKLLATILDREVEFVNVVRVQLFADAMPQANGERQKKVVYSGKIIGHCEC